jgi:hypothetical protein
MQVIRAIPFEGRLPHSPFATHDSPVPSFADGLRASSVDAALASGYDCRRLIVLVRTFACTLMVIRFACPNGHPLTAADELAGRPGKCPQCQTMFLVPGAPAGASPRSSSVSASGAASPGGGSAEAGGTIAFLCPNGHKLTGPRSLQGKAGQCPHCGSKFRIPTYEKPREEEIPVGEMVEHDESEDLEDVEEIEDVEIVDEEADVAAEHHLGPPPPPTEGVHPLAQLCERLCRPGEGAVEITFADGRTLAAEFFLPQLSELDYGVFAHRDQEGKHTVTAIPWSSIQRLAVSGLKELPEELIP